MKKIPYEEWGLKTIPALSAKRKEMEISQQEKVEVLYPRLFMKDSKVLEACKQLALERQPLHRKRAIWSAIGAPLTLPFALLPIIPNIPGFYLLFRAWSHWKGVFCFHPVYYPPANTISALKGAQHLEFLVQNNLIKSSPSTALDQLYTAGLMYPSRQMSRVAPAPTPDQGEAVAEIVANQTNGGVEDVMLLQKWNGKLLAESFELPDMEVEIERAVEQVENSIKAKELLVKEKLEIESGTQPPGMSEKEAKLIAEEEINQAEEVKKV